MVCIIIDTDGKTHDELVSEVESLVSESIEKQIKEMPKDSMTKQDIQSVIDTLNIEKQKMLNQFIRQIKEITQRK